MCTPAKLTKDSEGIAITVEASASDLPIEGNAMASGDDAADKRVERWIKKQLDAGNIWAWCEVHVRVTYRGVLSADAYLGGCSYKSEADFRHDNGYFGDLVGECLDVINQNLVILCGPAPTAGAPERS